MEWDNTSLVDIWNAAKARKWWMAAVGAALLLGFVLGSVI